MDAIGFRPLFLRNDFVCRSSFFHVFLEDGVMLLLEFFFAPSYFSGLLRNIRSSAFIFFTLRHKLAFSVCIASMPSCIDAFSEVCLLITCEMSVTYLSISTKIRKTSDICNWIGSYFADNQWFIILRISVTWSIFRFVLIQNIIWTLLLNSYAKVHFLIIIRNLDNHPFVGKITVWKYGFCFIEKYFFCRISWGIVPQK